MRERFCRRVCISAASRWKPTLETSRYIAPLVWPINKQYVLRSGKKGREQMGRKFFAALLTVCLLAGGAISRRSAIGLSQPLCHQRCADITPDHHADYAEVVSAPDALRYLRLEKLGVHQLRQGSLRALYRHRATGPALLRYLRQLHHARLEDLRVGSAAPHGDGQCNRQVCGVQQLVQQLGHFNGVAGPISHGVDRGRATEDDADADDLFQTTVQRRAVGFPLR